MVTVAERLERIRALQQEGDSPGTTRAAVPAATVAALALVALVAVAVAVLGAAAPGRQIPVRGESPDVIIARAGATAGFTPHTLPNAGTRSAAYVSTAWTKGPLPGTPGVVIDYRIGGQDVEVYEYADPAPRQSILAVAPTPASPTAQTVAGADCAAWLSPDGLRFEQIGFRTADGVVIFVLAPLGLTRGPAESIVRGLAGEADARV